MVTTSTQMLSKAHDIAQLYEDLEPILDWSQEEIYDLEPTAAAALQLYWLKRRFRELRPRIKALDRLAEDLDINEIDTLDDVIPLCAAGRNQQQQPSEFQPGAA
jgi:hypothetical protein